MLNPFLAICLCLTLFRGIALAQIVEIPKTLSELDRWYVEPHANENAATFFLKGVAKLQIKDSDWLSPNLPFVGKFPMYLPNQPLSPSMIEAITEFVQRNEPALPYFTKGAECNQSRYPIKMTSGPEGGGLHLRDINHANKAWLLRALWQASNNQGKESMDTLHVNFAFARSLETEPLLVSQKVRSTLICDTVRGLEQILNRTALPLESLKKLQTTVEDLERRESAGTSFAKAFAGQRLMALATIDLPLERKKNLLRQIQESTGRNWSGWTNDSFLNDLKVVDSRFLQKLFDSLETAWKQPYPERARFRETCASMEIEAANSNFAVSAVLLPGISNSLASEAESLALLRLAKVAIALERFRSSEAQRYPEFLTELVPAFLSSVPTDPFDGKQLRYRRSDGYVIYSIGSDLKNNNGRRKNSDGVDIVFEIVRPRKEKMPVNRY